MKPYYVILILILAISCQNVQYPERPDNLIPKGKMVAVLTEVYLSNAVRSYNIRIVRASGYKLDSMLYKKFSIDSIQFAKSHAFYAADLDEYTAMFDKVKSNLDRMKIGADSIKAKYTERKRVSDSLRRDSLRVIEMERLEDSIQEPESRLIPAISQGIEVEENPTIFSDTLH